MTEVEEAHKGRLMISIGVSGWTFLLLPAHPGSPGQMVVVVVAYAATRTLNC